MKAIVQETKKAEALLVRGLGLTASPLSPNRWSKPQLSSVILHTRSVIYAAKTNILPLHVVFSDYAIPEHRLDVLEVPDIKVRYLLRRNMLYSHNAMDLDPFTPGTVLSTKPVPCGPLFSRDRGAIDPVKPRKGPDKLSRCTILLYPNQPRILLPIS